MVELTDEQAKALEAEEKPARVVNPRTRETYVLFRQDVYELARGIIAIPNKNGWDDAEMDVYEQFRKKP